MSDKQNCWTRGEVAEAFASFHNPDAGISEEDVAGKLAKILEKFGQAITNQDIWSISGNFVSSHCVSRMAEAVIKQLKETRKMR